MNLPNKLTILRIILVPIMVVIPMFNIQGDLLGVPITNIIIDIIFIIASITDKLDGYIARKRNQITTFGKFADPLADKILVLAAMMMLVEMDKLPAWIPIVVIAREFIVSGYRLIAVEKGGKVIAASVWGKLKTATQMVAIILAFVDSNAYGAFINQGITGFNLILNIITTILMTISIIAAIFSGYDYLKNGKELFKEQK
ncbi:MAG: CDP-diacylglycerol--glycerol-3-phosphate 3-phosphatidyltransferase [Clostridia bacterium]|nr:CDP-diacylglycerol--glycerol-3-phosphate 3-phosphatidyltransferase [Clostridia bacterium]